MPKLEELLARTNHPSSIEAFYRRLEIVNSIALLQLAHRGHIQKVYFPCSRTEHRFECVCKTRNTAVNRTLKSLVDRGILERHVIRDHKVGSGTIYLLDPKIQSEIPGELSEEKLRKRRSKNLRKIRNPRSNLRHMLVTNDIYVSFQRAFRVRPFCSEIACELHSLKKPLRGLKPDGCMTWNFDYFDSSVFVEADRGTERKGELESKFERYGRWLGLNDAMIFVSTKQSMYRVFCRALQDIGGPSSRCFFTTLNWMVISHPFYEPIWRSAANPSFVSLNSWFQSCGEFLGLQYY